MQIQIAIGLLAAFALAACSPEGADRGGAAASDQVVNVYSGRHYDADAEIYRRFEADSGIKVRTLEAPGPELLQRLQAEGEFSQADLVVASDAGNLEQLEAAGLLQPISSSVLEEAIPARLRDDGGRWFGLSKRARIIVFDKSDSEAAKVDSYEDLADPRFRGEICVRSSTNVYNLSLLAERIARDGSEAAQAWAAGVKANFARDPQGSDTDQIKAVAAGVCSLAIVNHYYLVRMATSADPQDQAAAAKLGIIFPDAGGNGAHLNVSGAGVAANAPHRENAVKLLEYLASPAAQTAFADLNQEYPARADVAPSPALAALGSYTESNVPLAALGAHQAEAQRIYDAVGWR